VRRREDNPIRQQLSKIYGVVQGDRKTIDFNKMDTRLAKDGGEGETTTRLKVLWTTTPWKTRQEDSIQ
jgi:hypothetical protein